MNKDSQQAYDYIYSGCTDDWLQRFCHHYTKGRSPSSDHIDCEAASDDMGAPCYFLGDKQECRVCTQIIKGVYD